MNVIVLYIIDKIKNSIWASHRYYIIYASKCIVKSLYFLINIIYFCNKNYHFNYYFDSFFESIGINHFFY